ncbi:MAG: lipopolysaccharide heptosyltransferase II [Armatimonadetes bacterium]|nr:lipopolysaccharide heptosyltransferase II [Armatimonadota bacterium]
MKILIVKLNAIGDVLFATPLLEALHAEYPDVDIDWLVGRHAEPILRGHPSLRHRILYDGPWGADLLEQLPRLTAVLRTLRQEEYDQVYLLHRSFTARCLVWATQSPRRVGFRGALAGLALTDAIEFDATAHETERYLNLLRIHRPAAADPGMRIGLTEEAVVVAELAVAEHGLKPPLFGIAPGGGRNPGTEMLIKRWPRERYVEVAARLTGETGGSLLVVGSPDEADLCAEVAAAANGPCYNACGQTTLPQLAALLARCQVVVANDSGPLHIAVAAGVPTVALFGPTDPRLVAPRGDRHRYLWMPPDCAPCYRPDNARGRKVWTCARAGDELRCLRDISTGLVVRAALDALAGLPWPSDEPYHAA